MTGVGLGRIRNLSMVRQCLGKNKLIFINSVYANRADIDRLIMDANRCNKMQVVETERYINITI